MRDIKTKERDHRPKVLSKAARMPKELAREAVLEAREKSSQATRLSDTMERQESAVDYASGKAEAGVRRMVGTTERGALKVSYAAGRKTAQKTYEKLQGSKGTSGAESRDVHPVQPSEDPAKDVLERSREKAKKEAAKKQMIKSREREVSAARTIKGRETEQTSARTVKERGSSSLEQRLPIRTKEATVRETKKKAVSQTGTVSRTSKKLSVKQFPRIIKTSTRTGQQAKKLQASAKKQAQAAKVAKKVAVKSMQKSALRARQAATAMVRFKRAVEAAVKTVRNAFAAIAAGAGAMFVVLILIVGVIGGVFSYSASQSSSSLSEQVLAYTATIQKYASEYGIPEYVSVIQAIMMQESGGAGTDPMQSSECPYNTQYANSPGAIQDPEYSIKVGIQYYADCVKEAGCTSPQDMDKLKLSLQGYNYGNGYISWAIRNYGGYSEANALLFSQQQAASHGWARYGDPEYVPHVLQYYSEGNPFAYLFGNEQIVSVALTQLGNAGGAKFWSWYGFENKVSWCACFASWCADQSGLIKSGAVPKFSLCDDGITWFQGKGKWQTAGSTPASGSLIFFDWDGDGKSDHVGIVEKCEGGRVYTVEGNSSDMVQQNNYAINYACIMGYGVVSY